MQNDHTLSGTTPEAASTGPGIPWIILATFLFVTMDAMVKALLRDGYELPQVIWGRYFFHVLLLTIILAPQIRTVAQSYNLKLQLTRSVLMLLTTSLFFT